MERDLRAEVERLAFDGHGDRYIARELGITRHKARCLMNGKECDLKTQVAVERDICEVSGTVRATSHSQSLQALLVDADVDLDEWEVERWVANMWGNPNSPSWQVKAWLRRKSKALLNIESLIEELKQLGPVRAARGHSKTGRGEGRALEISIADPHFGMRCFAGASGAKWTPELAQDMYFDAMEELLQLADPFGPFDRIFFVTGNDFMHADNVFHTTTAGTGQPEMDSWHGTMATAEKTLIRAVEIMRNQADFVRVIMVPGNHARQTEFMLGRVLAAYFHNDDGVWVDAGPEPYKFFRYGVSLIGLDHGHSINPIRLGGIMAQEKREEWATTTYREWHLGDQHRKGVSSPSMEELGVSIEYLPSLIPWNEWHKIKGFSHQKRMAVAFVYGENDGCIAKLQANVRE